MLRWSHRFRTFSVPNFESFVRADRSEDCRVCWMPRYIVHCVCMTCQLNIFVSLWWRSKKTKIKTISCVKSIQACVQVCLYVLVMDINTLQCLKRSLNGLQWRSRLQHGPKGEGKKKCLSFRTGSLQEQRKQIRIKHTVFFNPVIKCWLTLKALNLVASRTASRLGTIDVTAAVGLASRRDILPYNVTEVLTHDHRDSFQPIVRNTSPCGLDFEVLYCIYK